MAEAEIMVNNARTTQQEVRHHLPFLPTSKLQKVDRIHVDLGCKKVFVTF